METIKQDTESADSDKLFFCEEHGRIPRNMTAQITIGDTVRYGCIQCLCEFMIFKLGFEVFEVKDEV